MKHLVIYCGPEYSRLKARLYPWVFVGCDWGSIILQAIGGGVAASAGKTSDRTLLHAGNGLIVAGISFQVATMAACGILGADFFYRFFRMKPSSVTQEKPDKTPYEKDLSEPKKHRSFKLFCAAIAFAYVTVLIRCIYRVSSADSRRIWGTEADNTKDSRDGRWLGECADAERNRILAA